MFRLKKVAEPEDEKYDRKLGLKTSGRVLQEEPQKLVLES